MLENIGPNDAELPGAVGRLQNPGGGGGIWGRCSAPYVGVCPRSVGRRDPRSVGLPQKCGAEGPHKCESAP